MISSLCTTLGAFGFFIYTLFVFERPLFSDQEEMQRMTEETKKLSNFASIKLEKITTNLHTQPSKRLRYLNLEAHLQPFDRGQIGGLHQIEPMVYDAIIQVASQSDPEKLNSLAGKILFEKFIKDKINSQLPSPLIKKIFFSTFIIQ